MTHNSPRPDPKADLRRRDFLLVAGAAAATSLAGCLGESRDPAEVETTVTTTATEGGEQQTLVDAERDTVEPNEYVGWELTLQGRRDLAYDVEVLEGSAVNVYLLEPDAYQTLEDSEGEEEFEAVPGSIGTDVESVTKTVTVEQGDYYLVVANADVTPTNA